MQLIEHTKQNIAERVVEKQKIVKKYEKLIDDKENENRELSDQFYVMENLVGERAHISSMQSQAKDKQRTNDRMKEMRLERRLKDLSKAQQVEITFLQTEIDRLRERTFPSFAVVQKRKLTVTQKPTVTGLKK